METNLDGITLLRYAHINRSPTYGGLEQYLRQLNDGLLAQNRMTILQMHMVSSASAYSAVQVEVEERGQGQIIWIPVCVHHEERSVRSIPRRLRVLAASRTFATFTDRRSVFSTVRRALANSCGHLRYSSMILTEDLAGLLNEYNVDLIILHGLSYDVGTLISNAARHRIPYGSIHHYDNGRLRAGLARQLLGKAAAVGGVSNRSVPPELQSKYVKLSDAVDVDFFSSLKAKPVPRPDSFVVLLPSRIVPGKGHDDLLLAAKILVEAGVNISIIFAGAVESESLLGELKKKVILWGLGDRVMFLGELTQEGLRDWYAGSEVVVLPSYSEGLPRVLLEAQAMGKPVIAYDSGGMPEALVDNKTGFLVRTGDHAALGERLKYLMNNPVRRFSMGESGREFVLENFPISALIQRHEQFYSRVLSEHPCKKS